jgi:molybdopterin-guanine dinucleotide biosynthesis protein
MIKTKQGFILYLKAKEFKWITEALTFIELIFEGYSKESIDKILFLNDDEITTFKNDFKSINLMTENEDLNHEVFNKYIKYCEPLIDFYLNNSNKTSKDIIMFVEDEGDMFPF